MRKFFQGALAAAVMVTGMVSLAPAPAAAQSFQIEVGPRGVQINEGRRHHDRRWEDRRDNRRWDHRRDHRRWDDRRGGRGHHAGRISRESVARCAQRYRSYDPRTHTYVVNRRGDRAICRL